MRKLIVFLLSLIIFTASAPYNIIEASTMKVSYLYPVYNEANEPSSGIKEWKTGSVNAEKVKDTDDYIGERDEVTWYVVDHDITTNKELAIIGEVNLILMDGVCWDIKNTTDEYAAISVYYDTEYEDDEQDRLTIYSQSHGSKMGSLIAVGGYESGKYTACAGIGGDYSDNSSFITINGGFIYAKGGSGTGTYTTQDRAEAGAGIGGGGNTIGERIVINGGALYCQGSSAIFNSKEAYSSGIGGGSPSYHSNNAKNIIFNGGTVVAVGGKEGISGIGSPKKDGAKDIYINKNLTTYANGTKIENDGSDVAKALEGKQYAVIANLTDIVEGTYKIEFDPCSADMAKIIAAQVMKNTSRKLIYAENGNSYNAVVYKSGSWTETTIAADKLNTDCTVVGSIKTTSRSLTEFCEATTSISFNNCESEDEARYLASKIESPPDTGVVIYSYDSLTKEMCGLKYDKNETKWNSFKETLTEDPVKFLNTKLYSSEYVDILVAGTTEHMSTKFNKLDDGVTDVVIDELDYRLAFALARLGVEDGNHTTSDIIAYKEDGEHPGKYLCVKYMSSNSTWYIAENVPLSEVTYISGYIRKSDNFKMIKSDKNDCNVENNAGTSEFVEGKTKDVTVHIEGLSTQDDVTLFINEEEVDSANYTVNDGSLKITLLNSYISTLPVGTSNVDIKVETADSEYRYNLQITINKEQKYKVVNTSAK